MVAAYVPLHVAARRLGLAPDELRARCEGPSLNYHGAQYGSEYVVSAETVDRIKGSHAVVDEFQPAIKESA